MYICMHIYTYYIILYTTTQLVQVSHNDACGVDLIHAYIYRATYVYVHIFKTIIQYRSSNTYIPCLIEQLEG